MSEKKKLSRIWEFLLIFVLVYLVSEVVMGYFFPKKDPAAQVPFIFEPTSSSFRSGHHPVLTLTNNTDKSFSFDDRCPMPPMDVFEVAGTGTGGALTPLTTEENATPCVPIAPIPPGESAEISLAPWKYSLFGKPGTFEVHLPVDDAHVERLRTATGAIKNSLVIEGDNVSLVTRFSTHEPGMFVKLFRTFITKPFLNFLILVAAILPNHSLGIAIILLTLVVKLILYLPTQHSMEGQRKMQLIQPKIEELRKRYKDEPQKLHEETMKLWREEKVNPFQSCLPILLQFPILIGLFYVIRDGSNLELSQEFLYPVFQHLDWNFNTNFLGLDLTKPSWIFPPLLVLLQYLQMRLSFAAASKKQAQPSDPAQRMQQTIMTYTMPLLIGFFAFQFPGAVSLYWGVSTLFAIGQQFVVNRRTTV